MTLIDHIKRYYEENGNLACTSDDIFFYLRGEGVAVSAGSVSRCMRENREMFDAERAGDKKLWKRWRLKPQQTSLLNSFSWTI